MKNPPRRGIGRWLGRSNVVNFGSAETDGGWRKFDESIVAQAREPRDAVAVATDVTRLNTDGVLFRNTECLGVRVIGDDNHYVGLELVQEISVTTWVADGDITDGVVETDVAVSQVNRPRKPNSRKFTENKRYMTQ